MCNLVYSLGSNAFIRFFNSSLSLQIHPITRSLGHFSTSPITQQLGTLVYVHFL